MANEKRLISADSFVEDIKTEIMNLRMDGLKGTPRPREELYAIIDRINEQPTVDAVEVVHGHWKEYLHSALVRWKDGEPVWADRSVFRCSRCDFGTIARHNYCPRCGAKMDLEEDYD